MKRFVLAAAAALTLGLATAAAHAADTAPQRGYAVPQVAYATPTWAGSYLGASVGYMSWNSATDATFLGAPAGSASERSSGWGLNAYYGHAWQSGNVVYGPELSLGTGKDMPITAEARMRLGYAFGDFLPFVAGGATFARVNIDTPVGGWSENRIGWNVGAGLDYRLSRNWGARLEYVYTDLGTKSADLGPLVLDTALQSHTVRAGLSYKF